MNPEFQLARFLLYSASTFFAAVMMVLWCYALIRTRLWFLTLLALASLMSVGFGLTSLLLLWNSQALIQVMGHSGFVTFYNMLLSAQVIMDILDTAGTVFLVIWLCRRHRVDERSNTK
jgi:hypothetical protein